MYLHSSADGKKPLVTIGGWTGSRHFSDLVSTSARRATLARNLASLVNTYGFAGVDIDWEYREINTHRPARSKLTTKLRSGAGGRGPQLAPSRGQRELSPLPVRSSFCSRIVKAHHRRPLFGWVGWLPHRHSVVELTATVQNHRLRRPSARRLEPICRLLRLHRDHGLRHGRHTPSVTSPCVLTCSLTPQVWILVRLHGTERRSSSVQRTIRQRRGVS